MTTKEFTAEVHRRAKALGLSAESIIVESGMSRQTWRSWSTGRTSPSLDNVTHVLKTLNRLEKRYT